MSGFLSLDADHACGSEKAAGLTAADQASIEAIAKRWGIAVAIQTAANGDYIVDHSEAIFVIDPDGNLAAILTGPFTVDALHSDFRRIVTARL